MRNIVAVPLGLELVDRSWQAVIAVSSGPAQLGLVEQQQGSLLHQGDAGVQAPLLAARQLPPRSVHQVGQTQGLGHLVDRLPASRPRAAALAARWGRHRPSAGDFEAGLVRRAGLGRLRGRRPAMCAAFRPGDPVRGARLAVASSSGADPRRGARRGAVPRGGPGDRSARWGYDGLAASLGLGLGLGLGTAPRNLSAALSVAGQDFSEDPAVVTFVVVAGIVRPVLLMPAAGEPGRKATGADT